MILNPGSFCDPLGTIYEKNNKFIVDTKLVETLDLGLKEDNTSTFRLEHERVKFISYPMNEILKH